MTFLPQRHSNSRFLLGLRNIGSFVVISIYLFIIASLLVFFGFFYILIVKGGSGPPGRPSPHPAGMSECFFLFLSFYRPIFFCQRFIRRCHFANNRT